MKGQCQNLDRISTLPQDTIEKILTLMPLRDALRTSILSRKWRYCWTSMPKLVFDDNLVDISYEDEEFDKYKLVNAILHVMLLHRGPILELSIDMSESYIKVINHAIHQIILHLSRSNNIKKFILYMCVENPQAYRLPCSFFSLQGLEHLHLTFCVFEVPLKFNGFSMLKSLRFKNVEITAEMLQRFLTNCPLLEEFTLIGFGHDYFAGGNKCLILELFGCLPSVQVLEISWLYIRHFAEVGMPHKLPSSLVHLRKLVLGVCFHSQNELLSALCLINSSPNLEKFKMKIMPVSENSSSNLVDLQDYLGVKLDNLKELEIKYFHNYVCEMEFVKLIMANSPLLKKVQIGLCRDFPIDEENKMLRGLLQTPLVRASPAAIFIIRGKR